MTAVLGASPLAGACPVGPILLAYLFRVAPDAAVRHLDDVSFAPYQWSEPCSKDGVLGAAGCDDPHAVSPPASTSGSSDSSARVTTTMPALVR